jgi:hypothetical protein
MRLKEVTSSVDAASMRRLDRAWPCCLVFLLGCVGDGSGDGADAGFVDGAAPDSKDAGVDGRDGGADGPGPERPPEGCNGTCVGTCLGVCTGICSERPADKMGECAGRCEHICVGGCVGTCLPAPRPDGGRDTRMVDTAARDGSPNDGSADTAPDGPAEMPLPAGSWSDRSRPETLSWPLASHMGAMVYDPKRDVVVMFGGATSPGDSTWEWHSSSGTWELQQQQSGIRPSRRYGHALVYNPISEKVLLYGGIDETSGSNSETWEWNGETDNWEKTGSGPEPSRWGHAMAFDSATNKVVVFGGSYRHASLGDGDLFDVWDYDGETWQNRTYPLKSLWPRARRGHALAAGPNGRIFMYGGESQSVAEPLSDFWEWKNSTGEWADKLARSASGPGPSTQHGMAHVGDALVLLTAGSPSFWQWDPVNVVWKALLPSTMPPARSRVLFAWDSMANKLLLSGGVLTLGTPQLADTWEWTSAAAATSATP